MENRVNKIKMQPMLRRKNSTYFDSKNILYIEYWRSKDTIYDMFRQKCTVYSIVRRTTPHRRSAIILKSAELSLCGLDLCPKTRQVKQLEASANAPILSNTPLDRRWAELYEALRCETYPCRFRTSFQRVERGNPQTIALIR